MPIHPVEFSLWLPDKFWTICVVFVRTVMVEPSFATKKVATKKVEEDVHPGTVIRKTAYNPLQQMLAEMSRSVFPCRVIDL